MIGRLRENVVALIGHFILVDIEIGQVQASLRRLVGIPGFVESEGHCMSLVIELVRPHEEIAVRDEHHPLRRWRIAGG